GWINCDRFYDVPAREKVQVITEGPSPVNTETFLIFTNIASVMRMERTESGRFISPAVSRNEPAVLFSYTVIDGRPHLCHQVLAKGVKPKLEFEPSRFSVISKLLTTYGGS
ncbi:MAG TPA: hypothetical protein VGE21_09055, partial [Flavobacteriales bacterium]